MEHHDTTIDVAAAYCNVRTIVEVMAVETSKHSDHLTWE